MPPSSPPRTQRQLPHAAAVPPSLHTLPASHIHPQCHTAPLVDDYAAPPPMHSTPHASFPLPVPATSAVMTLPWAGSTRTTRSQFAPRAPPVPAFYARDLRPARMGTATSLGATNPGGDNGMYAAPGFHIAPQPVQFESPTRAASTGRGTG
ncbi:hypothetical protein B0H14DRAFT_3435287 [Mycena olivaceomarginata]|nr:hypothetical protein B0H14DRAFT_3435287 [Mycena olivaceomarginata]